MASRRSSQLSYIRASGEYTRRKAPARGGENRSRRPRDRPGRVGEADRWLDHVAAPPCRGQPAGPPEISWRDASLLGRGDVAEWLRGGLQSRLHRFDSGRRLERDRAPFSGGIAHEPESKALNGRGQLVERRVSEVGLGGGKRGVPEQECGYGPRRTERCGRRRRGAASGDGSARRCRHVGLHAHELPESLGRHGVLALVDLLAVDTRVPPALRWQDVFVRGDRSADLAYDGDKLVYHRDWPGPAAFCDVRGHVDDIGLGEVTARRPLSSRLRRPAQMPR